MTKFSLATVRIDGRTAAAIAVGTKLWPLAAAGRATGAGALPDDLVALMGSWRESWPRLEALAAACAAGKADSLAIEQRAASLCAPLVFPPKVICAGANYYDHVREMGTQDIDKSTMQPFFFLKPPSTTVVGPGATVKMPKSAKFDWELELAVVVGEACKDVPVGEALSKVAGYTVSVDFTARDLQFNAPARFRMDWYSSKSQDTTCPIGPVIAPARFIEDPQKLHLRLDVNGETMQDSSTSDMIFDCAELLAAASRVTRLEPGDLILTGTPAGVGMPKGKFLKVGDKVMASIEKIGVLDLEIVP